MIAIALSCDPKLILADEPTTALDVTIQAQILELIQRLSDEFHTAVLMITHDLGIAAGMCDRVNVMYAGRIVETAPSTSCSSDRGCRTRGACSISLPRLDDIRGDRLRTIEGLPPLLIEPPDACRFEPRCRFARDHLPREGAGAHPAATTAAPRPAAGRPSPTGGSRDRTLPEAGDGRTPARQPEPGRGRGPEGLFPDPGRDLPERGRNGQGGRRVSFEVRRGETLGLVGESGCGKSTTGRALIRLREPTEGTVVRWHRPRQAQAGRPAPMRRRMQIIFQDPYGSLDPRMTVGSIISEPIEAHDWRQGCGQGRERVADLLRIVGLDPRLREPLPARVLGGQRQRIGVARARSRSNPSSSSATSRSRRSTCRSRRRSSTC